MTDAAWGDLSQQAIAAAGVVYFLALIAHLVEWSSFVGGRKAAVPAEVAVGSGAGGDAAYDAPAAVDAQVDEPIDEHRVALFGRIGLLLTILAAGLHLLGLVARGLSAEPNRVPWGNMYEFTISGTFVMVAIYLVLYRKFSLAWMGPLVTGAAVTLLMVAVIWLYDPVGPLPDALDSPWLVIHVVSAILATGAFTVGGLVSAVYLVKARRGSSGSVLARVPSLDMLDRTAYRIHAFAFPVWTFAVLITGPIWAHQAWSSYWNWDPRRSGRSSPGSSTRPTCTPARPPAGRAATPRSWPWSAPRRCGSTSSGSTTSDPVAALVRRCRAGPGRAGSVLGVVLRRVAVGEVLGLLRLGVELLVDRGRVDVLLVGQRLGLVVDGFVVRVRCGPRCCGHVGAGTPRRPPL